MPKNTSLYRHFKPSEYSVNLGNDSNHLIIVGQKLGPPSRRISLHQSAIKVLKAKITRYDKRGPNDIEVIRINHLPASQQVRLHTGLILYPGRYEIELEYKFSQDAKSKINIQNPSRDTMPSIDEAEAWQSAKVDFKL